jgi:nucleoside-triphosphatase THEP1
LKKNSEDLGLRIGAFSIDPEGLEFGRKAIAYASQANLLMIDEIGKLELDGGGWYDELRSLPLEKELFIILSVRFEFLYDVIHKWNLYPSVIYNVSESKPEKLISEIESYFEYEK